MNRKIERKKPDFDLFVGGNSAKYDFGKSLRRKCVKTYASYDFVIFYQNQTFVLTVKQR